MRLHPYITRLRSVPLRIFAFTYHGALYHYTIEPIERLAEDQTSIRRIRKQLRQFKSQKKEELEFVKKAVSP